MSVKPLGLELIEVVTAEGDKLELNSTNNKVTLLGDAFCKECFTCKRSIDKLFRLIRYKISTEEEYQVAFSRCRCRHPDGHYNAVVYRNEVLIGPLSEEFDTSLWSDINALQYFNRRVWLDSQRLVYCQRNSRRLVQYMWKDIKKAKFPSTLHAETIGEDRPEIMVDCILEEDGISVLYKDGLLKLPNHKTIPKLMSREEYKCSALQKTEDGKYLVAAVLQTEDQKPVHLFLLESNGAYLSSLDIPPLIRDEFFGEQLEDRLAVNRIIALGRKACYLLAMSTTYVHIVQVEADTLVLVVAKQQVNFSIKDVVLFPQKDYVFIGCAESQYTIIRL